jgi:hypothetical protein
MIAVLTGVGNLELHSLWDAVVKYTSIQHAAVRAAAARALARLVHDPESRGTAEQLLLGLLSDEAEGVQCESAEALGAIGTVGMVEPLLGHTHGAGRGRLRQAARGAIAQIQARLGDVEAGRVSLSEGSDLQGAVDLVDTSCALRVGELSLSDEEGQREPAAEESRKTRSSA